MRLLDWSLFLKTLLKYISRNDCNERTSCIWLAAVAKHTTSLSFSFRGFPGLALEYQMNFYKNITLKLVTHTVLWCLPVLQTVGKQSTIKITKNMLFVYYSDDCHWVRPDSGLLTDSSDQSRPLAISYWLLMIKLSAIFGSSIQCLNT